MRSWPMWCRTHMSFRSNWSCWNHIAKWCWQCEMVHFRLFSCFLTIYTSFSSKIPLSSILFRTSLKSEGQDKKRMSDMDKSIWGIGGLFMNCGRLCDGYHVGLQIYIIRQWRTRGRWRRRNGQGSAKSCNHKYEVAWRRKLQKRGRLFDRVE